MEKRTLQKLGLVCVSVILCSAASWWSGNSNEEAEKQVRKLAEQPVAEQQRAAGRSRSSSWQAA